MHGKYGAGPGRVMAGSMGQGGDEVNGRHAADWRQLNYF